MSSSTKLKQELSADYGPLKKLMNLVSQCQLCNISHDLVEDHLRYPNVSWESILSTQLEVTQRLQNLASLIIQKARINDKLINDWLKIDKL